LVKLSGRPGHTTPFIARLTRAYLNFEVKDALKARRLRRSRSLSSKFRYAFLPLSEEWIFPRNARREGSAQPSQNALMLRDDRFAISSA